MRPGVTIGGASFAPDDHRAAGKAPQSTPVAPVGGSYTVEVPAASAALVTDARYRGGRSANRRPLSHHPPLNFPATQNLGRCCRRSGHGRQPSRGAERQRYPGPETAALASAGDRRARSRRRLPDRVRAARRRRPSAADRQRGVRAARRPAQRDRRRGTGAGEPRPPVADPRDAARAGPAAGRRSTDGAADPLRGRGRAGRAAGPRRSRREGLRARARRASGAATSIRRCCVASARSSSTSATGTTTRSGSGPQPILARDSIALAVNVHDHVQREQARALGFEWFVGPFFATPNLLGGRTVPVGDLAFARRAHAPAGQRRPARAARRP